MTLEEGVFKVQEWMSQLVFVAEVAGVDRMLLPQHLCQQLVILFLAEDALFVVIHHILQMSAQIVVLDAFNDVHFYIYVCMFWQCCMFKCR